MPTLESLLLVPLLDYRAQADRHGVRIEVTVKVPEETFARLLVEVPVILGGKGGVDVTRTEGTPERHAVTIGGVRFECERV